MVRIMIVLLVLGSGYLGWRAWEQQKEIDRYEAAMKEDGDVDKALKRIQMEAYNYRNSMKLKAQEGIKGDPTDQSSIAQYVRETAQNDNVQWGAVSVSKPKVERNISEHEDTVYGIEHSDKNDVVGRANIANLFWMLERNSSKLKVSELNIKPASKTRPHEIPEDRWEVDFEVMVRRKVKD